MSGKRVAIIGAGVCGLTAIKSCLEEGIEPVCYEQHDDIGGIWYTTEDFRPGQSAQIYDSLILNTSKGMCCFSDFPFPEGTPPFPTGDIMHMYLKLYAENFELSKHIKFKTKVLSVTRSKDYGKTGNWDVKTEVDGVETCATFDSVLVCTGFYHAGYYPDIEGYDDFDGFIEHSQTFKSGKKYADQRVLVVGNSNSAGDVSTDVSRHAEQTYLSVGPGTWVVTRCQRNGLPIDFLLRRISTMLPIPKLFFSKALEKLATDKMDHLACHLWSELPPVKGAVMINDEIQIRLMCGKIKVVGNLARLQNRQAYFDDGTSISNLDGVIFATGLERRVPFLDPVVGADDEKLEWYKMVFPVHLPHNTLAMIGYFRTQGSVIPIAELQARLAVRVISGKHKLPPRNVMIKDVNRWNESFMKEFGRYKYSFPNVKFRDELAEEIGIKPSFRDLMKFGPGLTFQYYFGPSFNVHHRLYGPGAWNGAVQACAQEQFGGYPSQIRKLPKSLSKSRNYQWMLLLSLLLGIVYIVISRLHIAYYAS